MKKYYKYIEKPKEVQALQYTGDNESEFFDFPRVCGVKQIFKYRDSTGWAVDNIEVYYLDARHSRDDMHIETLVLYDRQYIVYTDNDLGVMDPHAFEDNYTLINGKMEGSHKEGGVL